MKTYLLLFLFFLAVVTGCMRDDLLVCNPGENLVVEFSYQSNGDDLFDECITSVDVSLFNEDLQLVTLRSVPRESLDEFRGTRFEVEPGRYHVVCWANAGTHTTLTGTGTRSSLSGCSVVYTSFKTGDPLYYGPSELAGEQNPAPLVHINGREEVTCPVDFRPAHRRIRIYVEGVTDMRGTVNLPSTLQIGNAPSGYDFLLQLNDSQRISYEGVSEWVDINGVQMAYIPFYLPVYTEADGIEVRLIKSSDSSVTTRFSLGEYLKSNPPADAYDVGVHIRYLKAGIEITVPGWSGSENVSPGF